MTSKNAIQPHRLRKKNKKSKRKSKLTPPIEISKNLVAPPVPTSIMIYSSLFFLTNSVTAFLHEYYLYSGLFFILTVTSVVVHTHDNLYTNLIDKVAVSSIVLYGGYILHSKLHGIESMQTCDEIQSGRSGLRGGESRLCSSHSCFASTFMCTGFAPEIIVSVTTSVLRTDSIF